MSIVEEIDLWLAPRGPQPLESPVKDDTAEFQPAEGISDWLKGGVKNLILGRVRPYLDGAKSALLAGDFDKLGDVLEDALGLIGFTAEGKQLDELFDSIASKSPSKILRELGDTFYFAAAKIDGVPFVPPVSITVGSAVEVWTAPTSDQLVTEIDHVLAGRDARAAVVGATGTDPGPDGQPTEFGIIEISAIIGALIQIARFIQDRKKKKQAETV